MTAIYPMDRERDSSPDGAMVRALYDAVRELNEAVKELRTDLGRGAVTFARLDERLKHVEEELRARGVEVPRPPSDEGWRLTPAWFTAIFSALALLVTGIWHAAKALAALVLEVLRVRP